MVAVDVEISSQSDFEVAAGAGNYHMGNCNVNNCSMTVGGNATAQQNAIVNVKSDVFANNSPMNELTLPTFHDSSNQIALHFLRDLDEYYRIKNVPEPLKLPLAMRAVTDPTTKSWFSTVYGELHDYEHNVQIRWTPIRHPQANPSERCMRKISKFCKLYCSQNHRKWAELLP